MLRIERIVIGNLAVEAKDRLAGEDLTESTLRKPFSKTIERYSLRMSSTDDHWSNGGQDGICRFWNGQGNFEYDIFCAGLAEVSERQHNPAVNAYVLTGINNASGIKEHVGALRDFQGLLGNIRAPLSGSRDLFGYLSLSLDGHKNENVNPNVCGGKCCDNPVGDRRPLPPSLTLTVSTFLFLSGLITYGWAGHRFAWDIGSRWTAFAGGLSGWSLMMLGFCVLLWGRILG